MSLKSIVFFMSLFFLQGAIDCLRDPFMFQTERPIARQRVSKSPKIVVNGIIQAEQKKVVCIERNGCSEIIVNSEPTYKELIEYVSRFEE